MKSLFNIILFFILANISFAQSIKLISPNGNEKLIEGQRYGITWNSEKIEKVNIYYSTNLNAQWIKIAENINAELGHFSWKVPYLSSKQIKIKVSDYNNQNVNASSDNYIELSNEGKYSFLKKSTGEPIKILPLGNSITFDNRKNDTRAVEDKIGYRYPLYLLLKDAGYNFEFIGSEHAGSNYFPEEGFDANAGFPGIYDNELNNLLATGIVHLSLNGRLDTLTEGPYLDTYSPDIILLHIGTNGNDVAGGTSAVDIENILDKIDDYESSSGKSVKVFLARIIDRVPNQTYVTTLNNNIQTMALDRINNPMNDAYPDNITIVNMQSISGFDYTISPDPNGSPGDMNDLLHPNDKGYVKIANTWFNAIKGYLGDPIKITKQPQTVAAIEGNSVQFKVIIEGSQPISYQWKKNGLDINGETNSTLIIDNIQHSESGNYYSCLISNNAGSVETDKAKLYVTESNKRVTYGEILHYDFNESSGIKIHDVAIPNDSLNLIINNNSSILWQPKNIDNYGHSEINTPNSATKLFDSLVSADEMTLEIWLHAKNNIAQNLSRIVSFSENKNDLNFSLIQNQYQYEFKLRTNQTNNEGLSLLSNSLQSSLDKITHLVFTFDNNDTVKLFINGNLISKTKIEGDFSNWNSEYKFAIANELNEDLPWLGSYFLLSIYNRALSGTEIYHNYTLGVDNINKNIIAPTNLAGSLISGNKIVLNWIDNSNIEDGYIVRRKRNNSLFEIVSTLGASQQTYIDNSITDGQNYVYTVSAFNSLGESLNSNLKSLSTELIGPTELTGFINESNAVELNWVDNTENELGYIIEAKANHPDSLFHVIDTVGINTIKYIDDATKNFSPYIYRVMGYSEVSFSNYSNELQLNVVGINLYEAEIPIEFELKQNYPNPFNPSTTIEFSIPQTSHTKLFLTNILGEKVLDLLDEEKKTGKYSILLKGQGLSSGIYFYILEAEGLESPKHFKSARKMILLN